VRKQEKQEKQKRRFSFAGKKNKSTEGVDAGMRRNSLMQSAQQNDRGEASLMRNKPPKRSMKGKSKFVDAPAPDVRSVRKTLRRARLSDGSDSDDVSVSSCDDSDYDSDDPIPTPGNIFQKALFGLEKMYDGYADAGDRPTGTNTAEWDDV
jgi:hypothetical protein